MKPPLCPSAIHSLTIKFKPSTTLTFSLSPSPSSSSPTDIRLIADRKTISCVRIFLTKMHGFVSYGHWDFCDGIPVAHYIEPVVNSKRVNFFHEEGEDLFKIQAPLEPVAACYRHRDPQMMKKGRAEKQQRKKQGRRSVYYGSIGTPKAVDEDLYKIPPELLYQIPKRKRILGNFLSGCLCLGCIA